MKRLLSICLTCCICLALISWGAKGHRAVAAIAERHLTPEAKAAIKELLGDQSLEDVSTWADEVRNQPGFQKTAPWHFLNVPTGLDYQDFAKEVENQGRGNIYTALVNYKYALYHGTREEKITALKFIVHFVGDAHQPMHISRAEDKGGNMIQIQFNGKGTNLHSLWDSNLIDYEGKNYEQMANDYDTATPAEIRQWQNDDFIKWIYESYQISSVLYAEIDKNSNIDDTYYKAHIAFIHQRIEMAGIRLAYILNECFKNGLNLTASASNDAVQSKSLDPVTPDNTIQSPLNVNAKDIANHVGQQVSTIGIVASTRLIESNNMVLLSIGAANPNQDFTIIIRSENRNKFGQPEVTLKGKTIKVQGLVIDYKGKPEIEITDPNQLTVSAN